MASPPASSNFYVSEETPRDADLYHSTLLLQILLADVAGYAKRCEAQAAPKDKSAKALVREIAGALANLDSKLRTNVRSGNAMRDKAKNTLTRLQHGLEYQLETSATRTGALAKAELIKDKVTGHATGQTSLNGFLRPKPTVKPSV